MNRKEIIIQVIILVFIVIGVNWMKSLGLQDRISEEFFLKVIGPSENFFIIVLFFLIFNIFNKGKLGVKFLLYLYAFLVVNLHFKLLLLTPGPFWARLIFLTLGAAALWFFYLPHFKKYQLLNGSDVADSKTA